jgi:hypothetical protein
MFLHFILHHEAPCAKNLKINHAEDTVTHIANSICTSVVDHSEFKALQV